MHEVKFAFTNYGVSVGLQAVTAMPERVLRLNAFFETYRSGDEYDRDAITHVMACSSHFPGYLVSNVWLIATSRRANPAASRRLLASSRSARRPRKSTSSIAFL